MQYLFLTSFYVVLTKETLNIFIYSFFANLLLITNMSHSREYLERALEESKRSLKEVVDEVVFCESELAKYKSANSKLLERIHVLEELQT